MSLLITLAQELSDTLAADPYFSNIPMIVRKKHDLLNDVATRVQNLKIGGLIVLRSAGPKNPNVGGPYFESIKLQFGCIENILANKTGKTAWDVAEKAAGILHQFTSISTGNPVLVVDPGITEIPPEDDADKGKRLIGLALECSGGLRYVMPQLAAVVVTQTGPHQFTATCSTPGAAIFYTSDGKFPNPRNATLYTGPTTLGGAATVKARAWLAGYLASDIASLSLA